MVKTGPEGGEEYVWRVLPSDNPGWQIGQVPTKGRVLFEAVEGEDLAGYVVLDQVCKAKNCILTCNLSQNYYQCEL